MGKAATAVAADSLWPETATADDLGRLLGLSGRRVRELGAEGTFPKAMGGRYVVLASVAAYLDTLRAAVKARPAPDPDVAAAALDGRQQRARLAKLQGDRAELELQRERGELVDAAEIQGEYVRLVTQARNRLMGVPSQAKGYIPHLTVGEVETLENLIAQALEEVAEGSDDEEMT